MKFASYACTWRNSKTIYLHMITCIIVQYRSLIYKHLEASKVLHESDNTHEKDMLDIINMHNVR